MLAQLKKTPVAVTIAFVVACSVCVLPALLAGVAAGVLVSAGASLGEGWVVPTGIALALAAFMTAVWLGLRHSRRC